MVKRHMVNMVKRHMVNPIGCSKHSSWFLDGVLAMGVLVLGVVLSAGGWGWGWECGVAQQRPHITVDSSDATGI